MVDNKILNKLLIILSAENKSISSNENDLNKDLRNYYGFDSLKMVSTIIKIEEEFDIKFSDNELAFEKINSISKIYTIIHNKLYSKDLSKCHKEN